MRPPQQQSAAGKKGCRQKGVQSVKRKKERGVGVQRKKEDRKEGHKVSEGTKHCKGVMRGTACIIM
jgi:hypothetical protein